jgi:hypothetical protein
MKQTHSWEANSRSAIQEIPPPLWNTKAYYRVHKGPPHVPNLPHKNIIKYFIMKYLKPLQTIVET